MYKDKVLLRFLIRGYYRRFYTKTLAFFVKVQNKILRLNFIHVEDSSRKWSINPSKIYVYVKNKLLRRYNIRYMKRPS